MSDKNIVVSREDIAREVARLGQEISRDFKDGRLVVIGILNGAFIFTADLVRKINLPLEIDFIRVKSYGKDSCSSGEIKLTKDVEISVAGKDVLLVEDIIDTGCTLSFLKDFFAKRYANSVSVCTLIDKTERRQKVVEVDYCGLEIKEGFLVGYGLDFAERHRQYADIYHLIDPHGDK
ncbi:MAG: hypoxanthine phosphoribosyltransferase [Proteobacteria bacterium]|nr:hypoxanthine phosphoribosyltransferase [Pseudomonadota bacterium]MBU1714192.1 hypoxanthine phosphoribosyltransferase [Pseudomonadota bacterium]